MGSSSVSVFVIERMAIIHSLKCTVPFSFVVSLLSLSVTNCHLLSLVVTRCHSLLFVVTRCTTRCYSLLFAVIRCHSMYQSSVFLWMILINKLKRYFLAEKLTNNYLRYSVIFKSSSTQKHLGMVLNTKLDFNCA